MNGTGRIPIPWAHRWRRFRHGTLPVLGFAACMVFTLFLWGRQGILPNAVGEVEAVRVAVTSGAEGTLASLPHVQWTLFDTVEPNQPVAQLDEAPLRACLMVLTQDLVRLRKDLVAEEAKLKVSEDDRKLRYVTDSTRIRFDVEQRRLAVLDRRVLVETDRLESQRLATKVDCLKRAYEKNKLVSELEFNDARMQADVVKRRLSENVKLLAETEARLKDAEQRAKDLPAGPQAAEAEKELAPLAALIQVQQARISETEALIARLTIRAPIRGTICAIHRRPGESVRPGDPIVTLAAEKGQYIVSYVRQDQRVSPEAGMEVALRPRIPAAQPTLGTVDRVGPQVELVPSHQCRDPRVQEWGLPVRITLPDGFPAHPGELIDVTFKTVAKKQG